MPLVQGTLLTLCQWRQKRSWYLFWLLVPLSCILIERCSCVCYSIGPVMKLEYVCYSRTHRYISTHDLFVPFLLSVNLTFSLLQCIRLLCSRSTYVCHILMSMHTTAKRFLRLRTALLVQYELGYFYGRIHRNPETPNDRISWFVLAIMGENNRPWVR
jgi:hypothetical protein